MKALNPEAKRLQKETVDLFSEAWRELKAETERQKHLLLVIGLVMVFIGVAKSAIKDARKDAIPPGECVCCNCRRDCCNP